MKQQPNRMDIATRKVYPKADLLRFVISNGEIVLDECHSMSGRGCYLYKSQASLEIALKKNLFQRIFHLAPSTELVEAIKERL